ncbi:hypothetical protein AMS68_005556 [Peltaster fructicola]|uniref:Zn(2)-C6 fungal-type domain-containing protein n=1 Tax=Peltaster fructicola TaxID=286661 RepID=A0A6H0XZJ9_9PEZI|nr:hypothetical protein AMS68_005556 [Peltaster fructicola]
MAQRKTHAKSRLGCLTCKRRHVKCNEERPKCDKCLKLGLHCKWATRPDESKSPATSASSPATSQHNKISSPNLGLADLRLLHHWLRRTVPASFVDGDAVQPWLDELVELGFEQPYLLHAMLAVAAVHKATSSNNPGDLCLQASAHIDVALRSLQTYIKEPDAESYVPIFTTASLMVLYKLGVAQVEPPVDPIADTYDWIRLLRGVATVVHQFRDQLQHAASGTLLQAAPMSETTGEIPGVTHLRSLVTELHVSDVAESCLFAVDDLHDTMLSLEQDSTRPLHLSRRLIFTWPIRQRPAFVELLSSKDPTALIILAHYAAVFHACRKQWPMQNWATWILDAVKTAIDPALHSWLSWPAQVLLQEPADEWLWPKANDAALPS